MIKLSIVITNYNKGDRIITLLSQLSEQLNDFSNFVQVVIVDDYSTDGSTRKIRDFISGLDSFILYVNKENLGPGIARNRGLDLCEGEWITFLDGDDEVFPNYIETLLSWSFRDDVDLICYDYQIVNCVDDGLVEYAWNTMLWTKMFRGSIFYDNHIRLDEDKYRGLVFGEDVELLYYFMNKTNRYYKSYLKLVKYNWGIGICNYSPDRYESTVPDEWFSKYEWLFK